MKILGVTIFGGISKEEKILFVNNMAVALQAGLTLNEALEINIEQSESAEFRKVLSDIKQGVEQGNTLSEELVKHPDHFTFVFAKIIEAGERSGNLEDNLTHLAAQLRKDSDIQNKVTGAMIYPTLIFVSTIGISLGLSIFVLPRLITLFDSFGEDLPFLTQIILDFSEIVRNYWPIIIAGIILAILLYRLAIERIYTFKLFVDTFKLRFPVLGRLLINMNLARINRTLGSLMSSGIPLSEALEIVVESQTNEIYKDIISSMYDSVNSGSTIYDALIGNKMYYPTLAAKMVGLGEKTGTLESTFTYLAKYYEDELYRRAENLATSIEPILLVGVGLAVGLVAIAIISPIYQLTGTLNRFR